MGAPPGDQQQEGSREGMHVFHISPSAASNDNRVVAEVTRGTRLDRACVHHDGASGAAEVVEASLCSKGHKVQETAEKINGLYAGPLMVVCGLSV